jgi:hypothetical protein
LREYLDPTQQQMMARRMGPTSPDNTFTDRWSGINKKLILRPLNKLNSESWEFSNTVGRRLRSIPFKTLANGENQSNVRKLPLPPSNLIFWQQVILFSVFLFLSVMTTVFLIVAKCL